MKKQFNASLLLMIEQILIMGSTFIFTALCARAISVEELGVVSSSQYIFSLLGVFSTLSLNAITLQVLCTKEYKQGEIVGTVLFFQIVCSVLVAASIALYAWLVKDGTVYLMVALILGTSVIFRRAEVFHIFWKAEENAKVITTIRFYSRLIALLYVLILFISEVDSIGLYILYFVIDAFGFASLSMMAFILKDKRRLRVNFSLGFELIKRIYNEIPNNLIITVALALPIVYLEQQHGPSSVAALSISLAVIGAIKNLANALCDGYYRFVVERSVTSNFDSSDIYRTYIFISFYLMLGFFFVNWAVGAEPYLWIFGEKYAPYSEVFIYSNLILLILVPSRVLFRAVYVEGLQKYNFIRVVPAGVLSVLASLYLIPPLGIQGAIVSLLVYYLIGDCLGYFMFHKLRGVFWLFAESIFTSKGGQSAYMLLQPRSR